VFEPARHDDPDIPDLQHRLLAAVAARTRWRAALDAAQAAARPPTPQLSATKIQPHPGGMRNMTTVIRPRWHNVAEVAMIGYGLSKTKMLVATGQIRSLKDGRNRRILPEWVDEYVARRA
jgi:hypothetical protein